MEFVSIFYIFKPSTNTNNFTPANGQCAIISTMTVIVNAATKPSDIQVVSFSVGGSCSLPTSLNNGVAVTVIWYPAINNQAFSTYRFTTDIGQCAITAIMTFTVNLVSTKNVVI